jgi:predicted dehydrogenase
VQRALCSLCSLGVLPIDVVYISTPHPFHHDNALLALNAGKHVLVEKAFALNAGEARAIFDVAASLGLVALEAMWMRWLPHMVRVREIITAGTLGEVRTIIGGHDQSLPRDPPIDSTIPTSAVVHFSTSAFTRFRWRRTS